MLTSPSLIDLAPTNKQLLKQLSLLSVETRKIFQQELKKRRTERERGRLLYRLYPDEGPLRRELYVKHLEFFASGVEHQERAFVAGNRTGKSTCVGYETVCHLIGYYPEWWVGRKFNRPTTAWICGVDAKAMRESLQVTLLGAPEDIGTGLLPRENIIGRPTARAGVPDAFDTLSVRHSSGGVSRATFKTYDQGRESYQGAKIDIILMDEEPPMSIYGEALMRTMATVPGEENGAMLCAFTPLLGLSEVVMAFMPAIGGV